MKCPHCKSTYDFGDKCPHCKVDTVLYKRTAHLSDKLYNQGLERLKASDFTHGINSLEKSVAINKNNTTARNLLGLALFEVGHIGDALTHWVISTSLDNNDNPAEGYLDRAHKNSRALEKLNDAVVMYNHALGHIRQKSDDLAIIQLKKAVENNPRFVDALNLLALCHLIQNDKERAIIAVERALSVDIQNPIANRYYSMLNPKGKAVRQATAPLKFVNKVPDNHGPYKPIGIHDKKPTNFHIAEILAFIIGGVIVGAVGYFLLFPAFQNEHAREIARVEQKIVEAEEAHQDAIQAITAQKDVLQAEIDNRDAAINRFEEATELQERINAVYNAQWLSQENQLREAINILDNLDTTGMDSNILNRIDGIREGAYPALANHYFAEGQRAFNASDYYKALVDLELAHRFMAEDMTNQRRDLMVMLGRLYYNNDRFDEALEMLVPVTEYFPRHLPNTIGNIIRSIENRS